MRNVNFSSIKNTLTSRRKHTHPRACLSLVGNTNQALFPLFTICVMVDGLTPGLTGLVWRLLHRRVGRAASGQSPPCFTASSACLFRRFTQFSLSLFSPAAPPPHTKVITAASTAEEPRGPRCAVAKQILPPKLSNGYIIPLRQGEDTVKHNFLNVITTQGCWILLLE